MNVFGTTVEPLIFWTFILVFIGTGITVLRFTLDIYKDRRRIVINTWRATERRSERIWPVINITITNHGRRKFEIKQIGIRMAHKKEISIPLNMFGDEVPFSIDAEDSKTYALPVLPLHFLPNKEIISNQVEKSQDAKAFIRNSAMMEFADKTKGQNVWEQIKKAYVIDATGHTYYSGRVAKTAKRAFAN